MAWLVALALILDMATTIAGLSLGLPEQGPVARRVIAVLGIPGYAGVEAGAVYSLYYVLGKTRAREWAPLAGLGPWLAGWANLYHIIMYKGW